jgi:uncharacterized SAM-binding protein YcdF (DUF218 family)
MHEALAPYGAYILALVLPPGCLIVLLLIGLRQIRPRPVIGITLVIVCCVGLWLTSTLGFARVAHEFLLKAPRPLGPMDIQRLADEVMKQPKAEARTHPAVAIVVLGGGLVARSPDYRLSDLHTRGLERLRYGLWLSRSTGAPVGFSGGLHWGAPPDGTPEARVAERIAREEYGQTLRWIEDLSRDTRENAARMVPLLRESGVRRIVLVTHVYHMPRALRAFREAMGSSPIELTPAPMGQISSLGPWTESWLPSVEGLYASRVALRELLGLALGR